MRPRCYSDDTSGFTLLEMLIVLALLSMIMVVLAGTISLGVTARARVTAVLRDEQDFTSFRRLLNVQLSRAYPDWVLSSSQSNYGVVDFYGATDHLMFLGPALEVQGQGLAHYWFIVQRHHGERAIMLISSLSSKGSNQTLTTFFASGLSSLRFEYFGLPLSGGMPSWQDTWINRATLPDLVLVKASFPKGDRRSWPSLVIHTDIDADISCVVDPQTHFCTGR